MCYVVLKQLLIVSVIFTVKGTSLTKIVDLSRISCVAECKAPQPRSVILAKEVQVMDDVIPYMITLYRCDEGSGCCRERNKICTVANWEIFDAAIFVKNHQTQKYVKQIFKITNHTACSCNNPNDTPK